MNKQLTLKALITASALVASIGVIQASETQVPPPVAEASDDTITIKVPNLKKAVEDVKIKVSGYAQAQYFYNDSKNNPHNANSGFAIRRAAISVKGEITDAWSAEVGFEIDSGNKGGKPGADVSTVFIEKAIVAYKTEAGKFTGGYQKPSFVMEEYSSSKNRHCIEQSVATTYFTNLANGSLAGRHGGIWWDGKVSDFKYGIAITNQYKEDINQDQNDGVAFYGNFAYTLKTDDAKFEFGINGVYNPGNDDAGASVDETKRVPGSVYGLEPYAKITIDGFQVIFDGLFADGESAVMRDIAWGANAIVAYRFENGIEPVARLAYLNVGNNANIDPSKVKNVPTDGSKDYDSAYGIYVGANFYANKYIKISAGYEYTRFNGGIKNEYANALRLQLQTTF